MPIASFSTFATGARQFVVHEAFDTIRIPGVSLSSLPHVMSSGHSSLSTTPSSVNFLSFSIAVSMSGTPSTQGSWKCDVATLL